MANRGTRWNVRVALVATVMFVVQSLGATLAQGAAQASLDVFGNPLCITSTGYAQPAPHQDNHTDLAPCCALGCAMASGALGAPPQQPAIPISIRIGDCCLGKSGQTPVVAAADHHPGNPRAPPLTA